MNDTKERPMLMSAPMVRAILDGTKTQTRRVVKMKPHHQIEQRDDKSNWPWMYDAERDADWWMSCPYGQPGDRLWVREAWQSELRWDWTAPRDIPPGSPIYFDFYDESVPACAGKKRPSIHMPRWASRITLEVTGVRVERLQDISVADALAEGVNIHPDHHGKPRESIYSAVEAYRDLWEQINGPGSWDANPWVWVIEFERIKR